MRRETIGKILEILGIIGPKRVEAMHHADSKHREVTVPSLDGWELGEVVKEEAAWDGETEGCAGGLSRVDGDVPVGTVGHGS